MQLRKAINLSQKNQLAWEKLPSKCRPGRKRGGGGFKMKGFTNSEKFRKKKGERESIVDSS